MQSPAPRVPGARRVPRRGTSNGCRWRVVGQRKAQQAAWKVVVPRAVSGVPRWLTCIVLVIVWIILGLFWGPRDRVEWMRRGSCASPRFISLPSSSTSLLKMQPRVAKTLQAPPCCPSNPSSSSPSTAYRSPQPCNPRTICCFIRRRRRARCTRCI